MTGVATGVRGDELGLVARLSLEQKVRLLTGADSWVLHGESAVGLRPMVLSDGPAGVRGRRFDSADPSTSLPSPIGLAATWDERLVQEVTRALGREARSKGIDVVLGPTVNIVRTPLNGRRFRVLLRGPAADLPHRSRLRARGAVGGRGGDRQALRGQRLGDRTADL